MPFTAVPPNHMTAAERLDEVAAILAAGCQRLIAREASHIGANNSTDERKFGLDFASDQRVHGLETDSGEKP